MRQDKIPEWIYVQTINVPTYYINTRRCEQYHFYVFLGLQHALKLATNICLMCLLIGSKTQHRADFGASTRAMIAGNLHAQELVGAVL
jgi:hypothetical protein